MRAVIFCWSDSHICPITPKPDDYVICADCGYEFASRCGFKPDIVIGDMDSLGYLPPFEKIVLPVRKDDTDTHYAVEYALKKGYKEVVIVGGIGGSRIDHMFANIQTLRHIYICGARGYISDGRTEIRYLPAHAKLLVPYNERITTVSFVPLCDTVGVNILGFEYEAKNCALCASRPLAVSNSMLHGQDGTISLEHGEGLVFILYGGKE